MSAPRAYFLTTDRLGFGSWDEEDAGLAMSLWGDGEVTALIGGPFSKDQVLARLAQEIQLRQSTDVQYWPVFLLATGDLVGCAGLRPYPAEEFVLEMGIHLRPAYRGQGLAQEAAKAVIRFAFNTPGVRSLIAGHHPRNEASGRLIRRLGFELSHEGIYPPTGLVHPYYRLLRPA